MSDERNPKHRPIRTFGRTGGRALSARQQRLIDDLLPGLAVPRASPGSLDPQTLFEQAEEIVLEIGFGGAEHLITQAERVPKSGFIGCEPFIEGVAKALTGIEENGLSNVRLHMDDARPVMESLKPDSIDAIFILFPDPWPKSKQQKRRLIQSAFLDEVSRIARPNAKLRFATDVASYANEALVKFLAHGRFAWQAETAADWRSPPRDHVTTRYETKKLGDCAPVWYDFVVA